MTIRFFIFIFFVFVSISYAGPLQDVSQAVKYDMNSTKGLDANVWFKDHPNLKILFQEKDGVKALFAWIGEGNRDFFRKENIFSAKSTNHSYFATYKGTFVNKEREDLKLYIYVPHPKIANEVEFGLNNTINNLMPPHIKTFFEKKVTISDIPGKLYLHKNGACSILLNFPSNAILRTYKRNCKNSNELENFTSGFDLARLKLKLTKPTKRNDM